jgi:hypothetical protein
MKNSVCSGVSALKDTWDMGAIGVRARGLSDYVEGSWKRLKSRKKISKTDSSWMKETLYFSF